jgi:hypothetical protein
MKHREYLDGPTAEELHSSLSERLYDWGRHTSDGTRGGCTPRCDVLRRRAGSRAALGG